MSKEEPAMTHFEQTKHADAVVEVSPFSRLKVAAVLRRHAVHLALGLTPEEEPTPGSGLTDRAVVYRENFAGSDATLDYFLAKDYVGEEADLPQIWHARAQTAASKFGSDQDQSLDDKSLLTKTARLAVGENLQALSHREALLAVDAFYLGRNALNGCTLHVETFTGRESDIVTAAFVNGEASRIADTSPETETVTYEKELAV